MAGYRVIWDFFVTSPEHSCKTVKIILSLYLENSDSKDNWKQKTWEDLVLKVMPTKSCSKNFIDDSMSRLPARYSVVVVFFFSFIVSFASYVCLGFFNRLLFLFCFFICLYSLFPKVLMRWTLRFGPVPWEQK